jgi:hypothetical protein
MIYDERSTVEFPLKNLYHKIMVEPKESKVTIYSVDFKNSSILKDLKDGEWTCYARYDDFNEAYKILNEQANYYKNSSWRIVEKVWSTTLESSVVKKYISNCSGTEKLLKILKDETNNFIYDDKVFCATEINEIEGTFKLAHKDYYYICKFEDMEIGTSWIKNKSLLSQRIYIVYKKLSSI